MAPTVSAERQDMGGIAYIHLDSKQAVVTCGASGTILFFQEDQTEIKRVEASCALNCLAASPKGDVFVVGDSQYVKVTGGPSSSARLPQQCPLAPQQYLNMRCSDDGPR